MQFHLEDENSPQVAIWLHNPCYRSPEQKAQERSSPFYMEDAELEKIHGKQIYQEKYPQSFPSLSLCGEELIINPRPAPKYLYDAVNFVMPCSLLDLDQDQICWGCINILDKGREQDDLCGIMNRLQTIKDFGVNTCECSVRVLQISGCRCERENLEP